MNIPAPPGSNHNSGGHVSGTHPTQPSNAKNVLFFSQSRADLAQTLWLAVLLVIAAMILFQLDDGNMRLVRYNKHMQEAHCSILSNQLQHVAVPNEEAPPEIHVPDKVECPAGITIFFFREFLSLIFDRVTRLRTYFNLLQWRGEIMVMVQPDDGSEHFRSAAHRTLQGDFSEVREFERQFLLNHPVGLTETCYYGPANGRIGVVFNLMAAVTEAPMDLEPSGFHWDFGLHVAKIVVGFFALLFTGLVVFKVIFGKWDEVEDPHSVAGDERAARRATPYIPSVSGQSKILDLQADGTKGGNAYHSLDLRGGTPRDFEEVPLGR